MQLWWTEAAAETTGGRRQVTTDISFKVAKRQTKPITFDIEGDDHIYSFTAPKTATMVLPMLDRAENELMAAKHAFDWLDKGLSLDDAARIEARLRDPEDDFDIAQLEQIVVGLVEAIGGRPTM